MATQTFGSKPSDLISPISSRHRSWNWPSGVRSSAGAATGWNCIGPHVDAGAQASWFTDRSTEGDHASPCLLRLP